MLYNLLNKIAPKQVVNITSMPFDSQKCLVPAPHKLSTDIHSSKHLEQLFNAEFSETENTLLLGNASEPLYLPASQSYREHISVTPEVDACCHQHRIFYRANYFASALHEIAHWCIAGQERRIKVDYGYWYAPDGRNTRQQQLFEEVESKPQALEWAFSIASNAGFRVSIDNLSMSEVNDKDFESKVLNALDRYCNNGFPLRAKQFLSRLFDFYGTSISDIKLVLNNKL
ncbi:elongation factor P hydroxylase [Agaribacter flavus]|uniref:Elongation factor P hydroxylase n=1 Tax=Agaribacter flavus TaxID=1902781 RepID=A0ABV7FMQ6_9ALTE